MRLLPNRHHAIPPPVASFVQKLPTELMEYIIDFLADEPKEILEVCSLVSKAWLPRSRAHLFRSLSNCPTAPNHLNEPFLRSTQNVQSCSHLFPLVKRVKVDCCHVPEFTRITFNTLRLEHLTRLWICRADFARFEMDISLTRTLSTSVQTLILDRVVFKNAEQLLHFVSSPCFSELAALSLVDISYLLRSSDAHSRDAAHILDMWFQTGSLRASSRKKITLKDLEIGLIPDHNIWDILYHPDSPFEWTRLARIRFVRVWDNGLIQGFLSGAPPSLTCLEFLNTDTQYHFSTSGAFVGTITNPSILPQLKEITLTLQFYDWRLLDTIVAFAKQADPAPRSPRHLLTVNVVLPEYMYHWALLRPEKHPDTRHASSAFVGIARSPSVDTVRLILPLRKDVLEERKTFTVRACRDFFLSNETKEIVLICKEYEDEAVIRWEPFSKENLVDNNEFEMSTYQHL